MDEVVRQQSIMENFFHKFYVRWIRPHISEEINQQRIKLFWDVWGYWRLLILKPFSLPQKLSLIRRFIIIDWCVVHCHKPNEISKICEEIAHNPAESSEYFLEAGCFQGGSSAKFSIICSLLRYRLCIYDSFEGVEPMTHEERRSSHHDYSGEYAATEDLVRQNIIRYGEFNICSLHKGWFANTLAHGVPYNVRLAFIDCDLAKGTQEALSGIVPALCEGGLVFTHDFHIQPVKQLLLDTTTWISLGKSNPSVQQLGRRLAVLSFSRHTETPQR